MLSDKELTGMGRDQLIGIIIRFEARIIQLETRYEELRQIIISVGHELTKLKRKK